LDNISAISEVIRNILDETNSVREEALKLSREIIRLSANSIRASHRTDFDDACELKAKARKKVEETKNLLKDKGEIYYTGYVQDAQKEYAESELTYAIIREQQFPTYEEINVEAPAYLNGLAEAIGESRRHVLDVMRSVDIDRADEGQFGVIKILTADPQKARNVLSESDLLTALNDVVVIEVEDKPGGLIQLAKAIEGCNCNISDAYGCILERGKRALFIVKGDNLAIIEDAAKKAGLKVLDSLE